MGFTNSSYPDMPQWKAVTHTLINCALCTGFWVGLAMTEDLGQAAVVAVLSEMITRKLNGQ